MIQRHGFEAIYLSGAVLANSVGGVSGIHLEDEEFTNREFGKTPY